MGRATACGAAVSSPSLRAKSAVADFARFIKWPKPPSSPQAREPRVGFRPGEGRGGGVSRGAPCCSDLPPTLPHAAEGSRNNAALHAIPLPVYEGTVGAAAGAKVCEIVAMKLLACDLGCVRGGRRVFRAISFSIAARNALLLTGPNGAGKSSLLRMIAGLIHPAEGNITLEGGDPELSVGEQSHYVGHLDPLKPALTVTENLKFWTRFLNGARQVDETALVERRLEAVGLANLARLPAGYLSAGQRRRLSLARVLAVPRPIWLLDEPNTALDAASQERLRGVMHTHLAGGGLIVAATHGPLGLVEPAELRLGAPSTGRADSNSAREVGVMDVTQ